MINHRKGRPPGAWEISPVRQDSVELDPASLAKGQASLQHVHAHVIIEGEAHGKGKKESEGIEVPLQLFKFHPPLPKGVT